MGLFLLNKLFHNSLIWKVIIKKKILHVKVQLFWEDGKYLRNLPHGLDIYLVIVQTMRKIVQIFVAFLEKLNFKTELVLFQSVLAKNRSNFVSLSLKLHNRYCHT